MNTPQGWIISDDTMLVESLQLEIEPQVNAATHAVTWERFMESPVALSAARWALFDLRLPESWKSLEQFVEEHFSTGSWPPLLGFTKHGYPVEHAPVADLVLSELILDGEEPRDWSTFLQRVCDGHRPLSVEYVGTRPALSSGRLQFLSYTPRLFELVEDMAVVARHNYNLLITGETGSGKTTLARLVHDLSPRCNERFLTVSCGALPSDLMGSELFGHVRGAFTGADRDKEGKFQYADGGTLVLEEIDTLDLVQQAKLLRVLEWGEFEPVGSNETRRVDVRVIVTANVNLERLVEDGRFRADLYYRLRQLTFDLPPLRERPRDIGWFVKVLVEECCASNDLVVHRIAPRIFDYLRAVRWPGNIRDLRNEIHRAVLFSQDGILTPDCLSRPLQEEAKAAMNAAKSGSTPSRTASNLADGVAVAEVEAIEQALRAAAFNRTAAAKALGISRVTLYNKMRKYQIRIDDDPKQS